MRITDVNKMRDITTRMRDDDRPRGVKRAAINDLFNGVQPWTDKEAEENGIYTNVQPLMATRLAHDARRQLARATMRMSNFFNIVADFGPPDRRPLLNSLLTRSANKILKRSLPYMEMLRGSDANVVLHGKGPSIWNGTHRLFPTLVSVEDLKVPAHTLIDLSF